MSKQKDQRPSVLQAAEKRWNATERMVQARARALLRYLPDTESETLAAGLLQEFRLRSRIQVLAICVISLCRLYIGCRSCSLMQRPRTVSACPYELTHGPQQSCMRGLQSPTLSFLRACTSAALTHDELASHASVLCMPREC